MSFDMDLFHYHQYNRIGDGSRTIIGVFTGPVKHDYAVRLWYSLEQRLWLAEFGPAFEEAVLEHRVLPFFEKLYDSWFSSWPEDEFAMYVDEECLADIEQRKIEIFTLYIMGLKHRWYFLKQAPDGLEDGKVLEILDNLEDIIRCEFRKICHVFGHPRVIVRPTQFDTQFEMEL
ncbi:uncharacterized protein ARMOST_19296 [Armillaria ostoyae]|uniref:Uncharacterized protein n=1 Tax=Armillaria ostoyae TaxID=47428 RepID=A0A284S453_ARMOS|nr:uncharacterized protein ARMOST_19296 [Armillaria ostoyae]